MQQQQQQQQQQREQTRRNEMWAEFTSDYKSSARADIL
jgi:hypothetical protein